MTLPDLLSSARKRAGLSLRAAAFALCRKKSALHAWERGKALPPPALVGAVVVVYRLSDDEEAALRRGIARLPPDAPIDLGTLRLIQAPQGGS